jgi:hypothetical protein
MNHRETIPAACCWVVAGTFLGCSVNLSGLFDPGFSGLSLSISAAGAIFFFVILVS